MDNCEYSWRNPDMSLIGENRRKPPDFPAHVFGEFWADWLHQAAEGAVCPVDYVVGPLLVAAAALIGGVRRVSPWSGWTEPSILWIASVGAPSSRKSPGADPIMSIIHGMERAYLAEYQAAHGEWARKNEESALVQAHWEKQVADAISNGTAPPAKPDSLKIQEPICRRIMINDTSIEKAGALSSQNPRGLLLFRDELLGWFGGIGRFSARERDRAFWTEAYGGRSYVVDRVKFSEPIRIDHLSISIFGGIQPDRLAHLLEEPDDGLLSRFLWLWPSRKPVRRPSVELNNDAASRALRKLSALSWARNDDDCNEPVVCSLTEEAKAFFEHWWTGHDARIPPGPLGGVFGKAPGLALRIALVLEHLCWCACDPSATPPDQVGLDAVRRAITMMDDYFLPMAEMVYGDACAPEAERHAAIVARRLLDQRPEQINGRELRRQAGLPGLKDAGKVSAALEYLVDAGWLRPDFTRAGGSTGRRRQDYLVNPLLFQGR
jgi:hypothetical protein